MSSFERKPAAPDLQRQFDGFAFTDAYMARAKQHLAKYPEGRQASAVMPLLDLAQRQMREQGHGFWVPTPAMDYIADMLEMAPIRVYEVATFYTMYNLAPVGEFFVQLCTTTPCWLRGSDDVVRACKDELGVGIGESTADGKFTLIEVECLGACVNAPMMQINDDYFEDLDYGSTREILRDLREGKTPKTGSRKRRNCEPFDGPKVLQAFCGGAAQ